MPEPLSDHFDLLADLWKAVETINTAPPLVRGIRAHHAVPYGRVFRQWDTNGQLWAWVNRGEIEDIPRAKPNPSVHANPLGYRFGIPVCLEST